MRNSNRKIKIIVLSILFGLSLIFLITSAVLRNAQTDTPEESGKTLKASVQSAVVTADADDATITIMPRASGTPSLQLTKDSHNTYISSGSYVNGSFGAIMSNAEFIRMTEVSGNTYDYVPSADRLNFYRADNGWYSLWACSKNWLGIVSKSGEYTVGYDSVKPVLTVYSGGTAVSANSTINTNITLSGSDSFSGVASYWYKIGSGSYYQCYTSTTFTSDGVYTFYCVDNAGNSSGTITVTKDSTAPTISAYNSSSTKLSSGTIAYTSSVRFEATDATTGVSGIYIQSPGTSYYTVYTGSVTLSAEGTYYYYARDNAGNQSSTYSVTVDRTAPTVYLYSGTTSVSSGYYSAASYVRFTASDLSGCTIYMKKDSGSYAIYTSGTNLTAEGVYSFYATDIVGNSTSIYTITLDRTVPTGTLYAGTTAVTSGKITNAAYVTYTATDNLALNYLYVYKPGSSGHVSFTSGTQFTADGWYYFYATDKSGKANSTVNILLDRTKPNVTVYGGGTAMPSGSYTNKSVSFSSSDACAGIAAMYVRLPGSSSFISYINGTSFSTEGTYYFYANDIAGNISDTVSATVDTSAPIGEVIGNGESVLNGAYVNSAFKFAATDNISGVERMEILRPNGAWTIYNGDEIAVGSGNGWYSFRVIDFAGNISGESIVCLLTSSPVVQLYANEQPMPGGTYTNMARISMSATGESEVNCYVRLPGALDFIPYSQYFIYSAMGRYEFYAQDNAGNNSGLFAIVIDRTSKPVTLNGATDGKADGNVTLTWENGDTSKFAPIAFVTVNGIICQKESAIKTIDGGVYVVKTTDAAGNVWSNTFAATRVEILSETLNKQYFETIDNTGDSYTFENYDNALAFAILREGELVRMGTWSSEGWDAGIPMDFFDSANAKNGTYYIYKKSGDKTSEVAYFTLDRLNAVIAEYAAQTVMPYYWWQKAPAQIYDGDNLYLLTAGKIFVGSSVSLADHANYLIDGEQYFGLTYSIEGEHVLTVYDDFGNSYDYTLVIVKTAPDIMYRLGGGVFNKASGDRQYVFKEAVTLKLQDALGGDFAMYVIKNNAGETVAIVSHGDEYVLGKSGRYYVYAINHGGTSAEITFILSLVSPAATFKDNADSKRLELRIEPSTDSGATFTGILIFKSVDGGLTWLELTADDYGRSIGTDKLFYEFNRDGVYRVVVSDNFRSGIDAITQALDYTKPVPNGTLHGVIDGGYTNGTVKFTWDDEADATVTFDGVTEKYLSGTELTKDGDYTLAFYDTNGFEATYTFTIKSAMPTIDLSIEPVNGYLTKLVTVTYEPDCTALIHKDGTLIGSLENDTLIDTDGEYTVTVTDLAGNITTVTFILDSLAPTATLDGVDNGGKTGGSVVIKNVSEDVTVKVYFNGELIEYRLGEALTAIGPYKVCLTDAAGNVTQFCFDIIYSVNAAGIIIIIGGILVLIGGTAAIILLRKRSKFRTNKVKNDLYH